MSGGRTGPRVIASGNSAPSNPRPASATPSARFRRDMSRLVGRRGAQATLRCVALMRFTGAKRAENGGWRARLGWAGASADERLGGCTQPEVGRAHFMRGPAMPRASLERDYGTGRRSRAPRAGCVHLLRADLNVSARLSQKRCAGCLARPPTGTKNMAKATSAAHAINQGPS